MTSTDSVTVAEARAAGGCWEFYRDERGVWFGARPADTPPLDLTTGPCDELDNLQILFAVAFLQRCGRDEDAARVFAAQTGCTVDQGREFCASSDLDPGAVFAAVPWPVATITEARDGIAARRRGNVKALAAYAAGAVLALVIAVIVIASM